MRHCSSRLATRQLTAQEQMHHQTSGREHIEGHRRLSPMQITGTDINHCPCINRQRPCRKWLAYKKNLKLENVITTGSGMQAPAVSTWGRQHVHRCCPCMQCRTRCPTCNQHTPAACPMHISTCAVCGVKHTTHSLANRGTHKGFCGAPWYQTAANCARHMSQTPNAKKSTLLPDFSLLT